ncbi:TonB-dependent receptor [Roseateles saccharophilus]|uniref:Iron complex outermembrane receptor protein n=2 Tax=Roseateles saccharophilus TaxID=304 RepID=A0A4R3UEW4_ROSSA|nr:iron complex outermembrane receptor protein [Roseateles saccharophilus]
MPPLDQQGRSRTEGGKRPNPRCHRPDSIDHNEEEFMKVKQTPIAAAVSLALLGAAFAAQAEEAQAPAPAQLDQVVITGIRASLQTSATIKKNATAIVDAVSAEDVGKLPDSDVGQALGRIPGISVGRDFGVGASVSIRGTDPQMTYTTLNGQTVASTGWYDQKDVDRSFNYSLLPPELIGGMEVYKSSQADLTEGGIGGTVIVKTRKPLDQPAGTAFVSVKMGKGSISGADREASGLYSWRNEAKTFGVLVAGTVEKGNYIRRGIEADNRWNGDVEPTVFVQDRKRQAANITLQARPVQGLELGLNYLHLNYDANNSNTSQYIFSGEDPQDCKQTNPVNGLCTLHTRTTADPTSEHVFFQNWVRRASMSSDSLVLDGSFHGEGFKVSAVGGSTKAKGGTDQTANFAYVNAPPTDPNGWGTANAYAPLPLWTGTIDATGQQLKLYPSSNQSVTMSNLPGQSQSESWANGRGPNQDKEDFLQLDASIDLDGGMLTAFKFGLRGTNHSFTKSGQVGLYAAAPKTVGTPTLFDGSVQLGGWNVPKPNIGAMLAAASGNLTGWVDDRSAYGLLNEKNQAAYGMFEFETPQLRGNFGLRYVHTKASATGYVFDGTLWPTTDPQYTANNDGWSKSLTTQSASYGKFLPSLNIAYDLQKDLILRFAAAQAMTRPNFANMFLAQVVGFNDKNTQNDAFNYGTPALKPQTSNQFDLGLEYYYGRGNLVSAALFYKKIDNFITTTTQYHQKIGVVSPDTGLDDWSLYRYINAGGGSIKGLELQANHGFGNGFGTQANYTFSNATAPSSSYEDQLNMFTLSSRHNANLVGYYEDSNYTARLAYSWRSKYMVRESGWYGDRMHAPYGSLDLSLGWNITKQLRLSFDATNLLKRDDIQYGAADPASSVRPSLKAGFPIWSYEGERTYRLGLSAKF